MSKKLDIKSENIAGCFEDAKIKLKLRGTKMGVEVSLNTSGYNPWRRKEDHPTPLSTVRLAGGDRFGDWNIIKIKKAM